MGEGGEGGLPLLREGGIEEGSSTPQEREVVRGGLPLLRGGSEGGLPLLREGGSEGGPF